MSLSRLLDRMEKIEGWFAREEAELLLGAALVAAASPSAALVEIGSYCGRSTVVLAAAARATGLGARVFAIDPHEGEISVGATTELRTPTLERFESNMRDAGVSDLVTLLRARSLDAPWEGPIAMLFIDGLHDERSVAQDFARWSPFVVAGGFVAFHDYTNPDYPGVERVVSRALAAGGYDRVAVQKHLCVLRKSPAPGEQLPLQAEALLATAGRASTLAAKVADLERRQAPPDSPGEELRHRADAAEHRAAHLQQALEEMSASLAVRSARFIRAISPRGTALASRLVKALGGDRRP